MEKLIAVGILENTNNRGGRSWLPFVSFGSTLIAVLIPKCPLCAMAIFSVLGIGFSASVLFPLTFIFTLLGLGATARRAAQKRDYKPLYLAAVACALILTGKFYFVSAAFYAGAGLFAVSVLWSICSPATTKCRTECKC